MLYPTGFIFSPKGSVQFCVVNFDRLTGIPLVCAHVFGTVPSLYLDSRGFNFIAAVPIYVLLF